MLPSLRQHAAPDLCSVYVGGVRYWFSFETCIAFRVAGEDQVLSENVWTAKTGRHLNLIESVRAVKLRHEDFLVQLAEVSGGGHGHAPV